jgi:hypothetical protein
MAKQAIEITGVWLRIGSGMARVLLEIDGQWRIAIVEHVADNESISSHIAEPAGADDWPFDPVTEG